MKSLFELDPTNLTVTQQVGVLLILVDLAGESDIQVKTILSSFLEAMAREDDTWGLASEDISNRCARDHLPLLGSWLTDTKGAYGSAAPLILVLAGQENDSPHTFDHIDLCVGVANNLEYNNPFHTVSVLRDFVLAKAHLARSIVNARLPANTTITLGVLADLKTLGTKRRENKYFTPAFCQSILPRDWMLELTKMVEEVSRTSHVHDEMNNSVATYYARFFYDSHRITTRVGWSKHLREFAALLAKLHRGNEYS